MGLGAIPFSEIAAFCDAYEIEGELRADYVHLLQAMDNAWLKESHK